MDSNTAKRIEPFNPRHGELMIHRSPSPSAPLDTPIVREVEHEGRLVSPDRPYELSDQRAKTPQERDRKQCPGLVKAEPSPSVVSLGWRLLYAGLGILFVGVGYIGMLLPGIPTIGPLVFASYFFARSCPFLEQRLIRNRFFAPILPYLDREKEMPLAAKLVSILLMWLSIGASVGILTYSNVGGWWIPTLIVLSGIVGTFFILRYGKRALNR